ncbi:universal stress protein [Actibacterium sp. 188UL27-1]|uniref:universal stress protein n=1 Tax=Actibacterium sp. 188UL27-1 TaxID=2786961 RepID=UPI0019588B5E|nr:universal stress protein [Actibacterium sp. 188UL27-1]MBM7070167.1 universal stress protein [Actibacterium sp. 188UL27-1]
MADQLLIPIDLVHESSWHKAVPQGFALASPTGANVTVMTVVPEMIAGLDWRYSIRGETGGSEDLKIEDLLRDARTRLEQIGTSHAPEGIGFDVIARYGTVYEEILNVADELPATQIVMAATRPSLSDYLIGPNTARVVRHAKCSVQVVRD